MSNVPTNLIPSTITQLPEYDGQSTLGYLPYSLNGRTYKVQFSNIAAVGAVPSTRTIATGNGLEGGGDLSQNRTISIISHGVGYSQLDFTGVVAGTYGAADTIPVMTVDDTGRVTAVVDTPVVLSNYVPTSRTVTAGAGLTGGGQLSGNITISLNPSNATPLSLGVASAGTGTQAARDDHVHPAVDLTDTSETQGVLPLGRGGTGVDLSPVLGAVIYADNDSLNQTVAGNAGQVLTSAGGLGAPYWQTITGIGTVTSVDVSGGTTGLTTSGGPVTAAGTITLGGTLNVANGGTGATSAATARSNLGAAASGANTDITSVALTTGTISTAPASNTDIANKAYVDGLVTSGISYHAPVKYEVPNTTGNLTATYNNGTAGVGATLTNAGTLAAFTPDGVVAQVGDRILIYNQTDATQNGVYTVTTVGSGSVAWVLTRATDADSYGLKDPDALGNGDAFFVQAGDTGAGETYVCNTPGVITFGTTNISFTQVSSSQVYSAGTGLTLTNTTFSITATGVTAASYGSASSVPVLTVNAQGQITSASSSSIAIAASQITSGSLAIANGGTGAGNAASAFNNLSPITTEGDIIIGNGANSATRLGIGANGYILTSNGTTAVWNPAPSSMVYPGAGIPLSAGSSWGTSFNNSGNPITVAYGGTGTGTAFTSGSVVFASASGVYNQNNSQFFWDNPNNRLGIGTATPGSKVEVASPTSGGKGGEIIIANSFARTSGNYAQLAFKPNSDYTGAVVGAFIRGLATNADPSNPCEMVFGTGSGGAPTERMRIDVSGNVGIGTSSPGSPLDVVTTVSGANGITVRGRSSDEVSNISFKTNNAATTYAQIQGRSTELRIQTGSTLPVTIYTNSTEYFRIGPAGQIGLSGANYGTSGQILTSNGSGSAPTWQNAPATGVTQARATALSMILGF